MYHVTEEQVEDIQRIYKTDRKKVAEDVKILEEWLKKQPHLPQTPPFDGFLERFLVMSQYRVEHAKSRIERYFTGKSRNKDLFKIFSEDTTFLPSHSNVLFVAMSKLGPGFERICVGRFLPERKHNWRHFLYHSLSLMELYVRHDRTNSFVFVGDCRHVSEMIKSSFTRADFAMVFRLGLAVYTTYTMKLAGFHFLNMTPGFQMLINILSTFIKPKIMKRIQIHDSIESLHRVIAKEYLPEEFGGTGGSMLEIQEHLDKMVEENRPYLIDLENFLADDDKRVGDCKSDEMFGVNGTFRNINLD